MSGTVDRHVVRDALRAELGEARWRRFVADANGRRDDMTRLFHWQRDAWERVRVRLGIAPLGHDELLALLRFCPVHDTPLACEDVPIRQRRRPTPAHAAQAEAGFPFANTFSPGLGLAGEGTQSEAWYCADCRTAEAAWEAARPPEPPPGPRAGAPCARCGGADTVLDDMGPATALVHAVCSACGHEQWSHAVYAIDPAALPRRARYVVVHRPDGVRPALAACLLLKRFGASWTRPSRFDAAALETAFRSGSPAWHIGTTWDGEIDELARRAGALGLPLEFILED